MNKSVVLFGFLLFVTFSLLLAKAPEEGQYPLSEIKKLNLQKAGLLISQDDIYNPDGISLIDALVKVNGCTGSFVSPEGLIITNHHCAFAGVNAASTPEHNYLEDGFLAESREKEIHAKGYKVKITESYEDVSDIILKAVEGIDDLAERSKIISKKMEELGIGRPSTYAPTISTIQKREYVIKEDRSGEDRNYYQFILVENKLNGEELVEKTRFEKKKLYAMLNVPTKNINSTTVMNKGFSFDQSFLTNNVGKNKAIGKRITVPLVSLSIIGMTNKDNSINRVVVLILPFR